MKEINFYGTIPEYRFLSNFHECPQIVETEWGKHEYPTNEHFYQSMKATTKEDHELVRSQSSPYYAMKTGRKIEYRDDWEDIKVFVMLKGLRAKFKDEDLRARLLATGDAILHEASPYDMFWGKKGADWLGKLLMQVRDEIK